MDSPKDVCAICLDNLRGQALFTAECSHTFHFTCITNNVQHGNQICPTCRATWTNVPSRFTPATNNAAPPQNMFRRFRNLQPFTPELSFADDEPLPTPEPNISSTPTPHSQRVGEITVKALPERLALSRSEQSDLFSVLVGIRAPPLSPEASDRPDARAPVDLVAVLDISGSMSGNKIRLLKQAMRFVVDNLGPTDRLSVISFATSASRVAPLRRMTDAGRTATIQAVNSLRPDGATNIIAGLKMAVQVLEQRRQKNPVASMILLSDGQDNQNGEGDQFLQALRLLPHCIRTNDAADQSPQGETQTDVVPVSVHTFGFGSDHDAAALHGISDGSGGTFSYIESIEIIQDAFAQCIGGLLSVVAQDVQIHVESGSIGVQIQSINSGRYRNRIENEPEQHGIVYVEDVYAEEEKQFLVNLSVPLVSAEEAETLTTKLLEVKCSYKDPLCNESVTSETVTVEIRRPTTEGLSEADREVHLEVDRERNRISISEGIAEAQELADRGELEGARALLGRRKMRLLASSSAQAGDKLSRLLDSDVTEIESRMLSSAEYEGGGKAYAFSKRSSHQYQRASTQAVKPRFGAVGASLSAPAPPTEAGYQTSSMHRMVQKSKESRNSSSSNQGKTSGGGTSNSNQP